VCAISGMVTSSPDLTDSVHLGPDQRRIVVTVDATRTVTVHR